MIRNAIKLLLDSLSSCFRDGGYYEWCVGKLLMKRSMRGIAAMTSPRETA